MRAFLVLVVLFLSAGQEWLWACGDKFFLVGTGVRFNRPYRTVNKGDVLIYTGGKSSGNQLLRENQQRLAKAFGMANHHVLLAESPAALEKALTSMNVDLVFTDFDTAVSIEKTVLSATTKPRLVGGVTDKKDNNQKGDKQKGAAPLQAPATEGTFTIVDTSDSGNIIKVLRTFDDELGERRAELRSAAKKR